MFSIMPLNAVYAVKSDFESMLLNERNGKISSNNLRIFFSILIFLQTKRIFWNKNFFEIIKEKAGRISKSS